MKPLVLLHLNYMATLYLAVLLHLTSIAMSTLDLAS